MKLHPLPTIATLLFFGSCAPFGTSPEGGDPPGNGGPDGGSDSTIGAEGITLTIVGDESPLRVVQGKSASLTLKLTRAPTATGRVDVSVKNLPQDVVVAPISFEAGQSEITVVVVAATSSPQGPASAVVEAVLTTDGARAQAALPLFVRGVPGSLDTTFASTGILAKIPAPMTEGLAGGKVLSSGNILAYGSVGMSMGLVRVSAVGAIDSTFGDGGVTTLAADAALVPQTPRERRVDEFASGPETGKILVLTNKLEEGSPPTWRLLPNGKVDSEYGINGRTHPDSSLNVGPGFAAQVVARPDGTSLVLAHYATMLGAAPGPAISRWKADGTIDSAYGTSGYCRLDRTGTMGNAADAMYVHADGRQTLPLQVRSGTTPPSLALLGCAADGSPDTSLGTASTYFVQTGVSGGLLVSAATADGGFNVLLSPEISTMPLGWTRITSNGAPDTSLSVGGGTPGRVTLPVTRAVDIASAADGKMLVVTTTSDTPHRQLLLIRFKPDGAPDETFGNAGRVITAVGDASKDVGVSALLLQPDGRIIVIGAHSGGSEGMIVRYWD